MRNISLDIYIFSQKRETLFKKIINKAKTCNRNISYSLKTLSLSYERNKLKKEIHTILNFKKMEAALNDYR